MEMGLDFDNCWRMVVGGCKWFFGEGRLLTGPRAGLEDVGHEGRSLEEARCRKVISSWCWNVGRPRGFFNNTTSDSDDCSLCQDVLASEVQSYTEIMAITRGIFLGIMTWERGLLITLVVTWDL